MNYPATKDDQVNNEAILDESLVAEARATMRDKFPRIVLFFLEDSEMYIRQIQEGINVGNVESVIPPSHTLKSSAYQMGARKLSGIAKAIETQAREILKNRQDASALTPHLKPLFDAFSATREAYDQKKAGGA